MNTRLRFYRHEGKWYADVPGRSMEDNEMVFGADSLLDIIAEERKEVFVNISDKCSFIKVPFIDIILKRREHDDDGAWYKVERLRHHSNVNYDLYNKLMLKGLWLCNVTHDVFGEHPENIYITIL